MAAVTWQTRYLDKYDCDATGTFRFERPGDYRALAGQWFRLTLETREGEQTKTFSDAAAPQEISIDLSTRLTGSAFKDALLEMVPGHVVTIAGPGGRLVVPEGTKRLAMLMGGVGIAPGRAIIRDHVLRADPTTRITLFMGNNAELCEPFQAEFVDYDERVPWFDFVNVIARPDHGWGGESGFITAELVTRHIDVADDWLFMVAGPPAMLEPMRTVLDELEIPAERRMFESFSGY